MAEKLAAPVLVQAIHWLPVPSRLQPAVRAQAPASHWL
jgi:hypothetical protein